MVKFTGKPLLQILTFLESVHVKKVHKWAHAKIGQYLHCSRVYNEIHINSSFPVKGGEHDEYI